ncbi:MAG: hypothetical protein HYV19_06290 [Gemmatimonadetes bacterium]|nr:hypothetical protein [Gemmatimonadota bacterium]
MLFRLSRWMLCTAVLSVACGGSEGGTAPTPAPVKDPNVIGPTGGTITATGGGASLVIPSGALAADVKITVTPKSDPAGDTRAMAGTGYEFGPEGTQFSQPVTLSLKYDKSKLPAGADQRELRVAQLTSEGVWVPMTDSFIIDSTSGQVKISVRKLGGAAEARLMAATEESATPYAGTLKSWHWWSSSWTVYYPPYNPCTPLTISTSTSYPAQLLAGDCVQAGNSGRRTDFYNVTTTGQTVLSLNVSGGITGPFGLQASGLVAHAAATSPNTLSTVVPAGTWTVFVTGADSTTRGDYTISTSTAALSTRTGCENLAVIAGQSISGTVQSSDCSAQVPTSTPMPQFVGKTFYFDLYRARLFAGKTYTVSLTHQGGTAANGCLVAWLNGQIVTSVLDKGAAVNPKVLTITPPGDLYYTFEVESCSTNGDQWAPAASMGYTLNITG